MNTSYFGLRAATFITLALPALLVACGGGGGGGAAAPSPGSGVSYAGLTTEAVVTEANAAPLASTSYQGGSAGPSLVGLSIVNAGERPPGLHGSFTVILNQSLESAVKKVEVRFPQSYVKIAAVVQDNGVLYDDCSNAPNGSYTITGDDQTGSFNGTLQFNGYCSSGVILTGSATFSGNLDPAALSSGIANFQSLSMATTNLRIISGSDALEFSGSLAYDFTGADSVVDMNMLVRDSATTEVFQCENLRMTATGQNPMVVDISQGRFYHPEYGYVSVTTPTPFRLYYGDSWPSEGVLLCAGSQSAARLTAVSGTQYQVTADTDGDGQFDDYDSGLLLWADI